MPRRTPHRPPLPRLPTPPPPRLPPPRGPAAGYHANKEGRTAGINLGGGYATFPGVLGTAVTKNPHRAFRFKGGAKGDKVTVSWKDNKGETRTDEAAIA